MKILIVNFSDIDGGAARAAHRLHKALLTENIDSKMLVEIKKTNDFTILGPENIFDKIIVKFKGIRNKVPLFWYKKPSVFSPSSHTSSNLIKKINSINPDIVHLHWINAGMLSVKDISKIKAPIIWSLHDNWAFTGGCHIMESCKKYIDNCGKCPKLNSNSENDLSRKLWKKKKRSYNKINNLTIIGLSNWINESSKKSSLLKNRPHINLPNLINTKIFKPINKSEARNLLNLPLDKKLILFGAYNSLCDTNKGFLELTSSLKEIESNVELVIFGSNQANEPYNFGFKAHYLWHLHDDISLVTLYNAADVTVVPSLQENLSNTIMESLSCGTPVVGFNIGGNSDLIEHKANGYLAEPFSAKDLAKGIEWVIAKENTMFLSDNARQKVIADFDSKIVAKEYIKLYKKILKQ